jgi:hypothetical protein
MKESKVETAGPSISRAWAMPSPDTFSIPPIAAFIARWSRPGYTSIDMFARRSILATHRNDLNPEMPTDYHMDAADFCAHMVTSGVMADLVFFDPPYSPRQIAECYQGIGRPVTSADTQNAALYKRVRDAVDPAVKPGGTVLSFGWNSAGMGKSRGYTQREILLVAHGGAHNDTICVAETKDPRP